MKRENEDLLNRNYTLNQEIRDLKTRFDKFYVVEKDNNGLKEQNGTMLRQIKNYQEALSRARSEEENVKKQLASVIKSVEDL